MSRKIPTRRPTSEPLVLSRTPATIVAAVAFAIGCGGTDKPMPPQVPPQAPTEVPPQAPPQAEPAGTNPPPQPAPQPAPESPPKPNGKARARTPRAG